MIYLFWKDLELHKANALQFALVKGGISPLTLLGWAGNIKYQLASCVSEIKESAAIIIYSCQEIKERSIYRSYTPGDAHLLKQRITTTPRQFMSIDLILRLEARDEKQLIEALEQPEVTYLLQNMILAKSFCFSAGNSTPALLLSREALCQEIFTRPVTGFFPVAFNRDNWLDETSVNTASSNEDRLDELLRLLSESIQYEKIHDTSGLFPLITGLRLLNEPCSRKHAREDYPHAFAEPLISLAKPLYLFQFAHQDLNRTFWHSEWQGNDFLAVNNPCDSDS